MNYWKFKYQDDLEQFLGRKPSSAEICMCIGFLRKMLDHIILDGGTVNPYNNSTDSKLADFMWSRLEPLRNQEGLK